MAKECEQRLQKIADGFRECRKAFTAIGDGTRQSILLALLEGEPSAVRVGEIARKAHLTRPSVSHHPQILKESGIVAMRREGTKNDYHISADETRWKEIAELMNLVYESVGHIGAPEYQNSGRRF